MATKFTRNLGKKSNGVLVGYGGYAHLVLVGDAVHANLTLVEDSNKPGVYYRDAVPRGEYKIYVDLDKDGTPVEGDLYRDDNDVAYPFSHIDDSMYTIADNFDSDDSHKLKATGVQDQMKTVTAPTSPAPDYLGQIGKDAQGVIYAAIATSGTIWVPVRANKYFMQDSALYISENKVVIPTSARIFNGDWQYTGTSPYITLPADTYTIGVYGILVVNMTTGSPVIEEYSWYPPNTNTPYDIIAGMDSNIIPLAYRDGNAKTFLISPNIDYSSVYVTRSFYKDPGTFYVKNEVTYIIGHTPKGDYSTIAADSTGVLIGVNQVLVLNLLDASLSLMNWSVKTPPFYHYASHLRVIAFRLGNDITIVYENDNRITSIEDDIQSLQNQMSDAQFADPVIGCEVTAQGTPDMSVSVASGTVFSLSVTGGDVNIDLPTADTAKFEIQTLTTNYQYLYGTYSLIATVYPNNIVVKNNSTQAVLTEGVDYETNSVDTGRFIQLRMLSGSLECRIEYDSPNARIDTILVNLTTGALSVQKGSDHNEQPSKSLAIPANYHRLANVFVRWGATTIIDSNIVNIPNRDYEGYTAKELFLKDSRIEDNHNKLFNFYNTIGAKYATSTPIRIAFFGDSTVDQLMSGMVDAGKNYGYFGRFVEALHLAYPDAEIQCWKIITDGTKYQYSLTSYQYNIGTSQMVFHLYNYAQGSHSIAQLLHDGGGAFDSNAAGFYSVLYDNEVAAHHDLFIMGRTNNCLLKTHANDDAYRAIYTASPYSLTLYDKAEYTDTDKLKEDDLQIFRASLQRIYNDVTAQTSYLNKTDFIITSETPDNLIQDQAASYPTTTDIRWQGFTSRDFARENNLLFIDFMDICRNVEKYLGIPPEASVVGSDYIHPSILLNKYLSTRLEELIKPQ